jgi:PD-(D/E)XK nuclease superfamily
VLRISQRHLKILEACPRQFEHTYFDRLTLPIKPAQQVKTQLGSDFHLLMHQRELGLPIGSMTILILVIRIMHSEIPDFSYSTLPI